MLALYWATVPVQVSAARAGEASAKPQTTSVSATKMPLRKLVRMLAMASSPENFHLTPAGLSIVSRGQAEFGSHMVNLFRKPLRTLEINALRQPPPKPRPAAA